VPVQAASCEGEQDSVRWRDQAELEYLRTGTAIQRFLRQSRYSAAQRSPVTFCDDHRAVFATANGRIQLTAGILAAAQVVLASLRAPHLDRGCGPAAVATAQETVDKEHCR